MIRKIIRLILGREAVGKCTSSEKKYDGLPDGIAFEQIATICAQYFTEPILSVKYTHLSGWKSAGAFRFFVETNARRNWTLIYKNAIYGNEHTPALEGLPLQPGYPEYLICQYSNPALQKYLPKIYHCKEIKSHKHYQYFFEDLGGDFKRIEADDEFLTAAAELPNIQKALLQCEEIPFNKEALRFDEHFFNSLDKYCRTNLNTYYEESPDRLLKKVLGKLPDILAILKSDVPRRENTLVPIHGDYNPANILINKNGSRQLKILDWEWMGLGLKHADLASLLKPVSSKIEREAIKLFAQNDNTLSIIEHERFYYLAKMERGLFDAAFFAKHYLTSKSESNINIPNHIKGALSRVKTAYNKVR